jgi:hypothetical protein
MSVSAARCGVVSSVAGRESLSVALRPGSLSWTGGLADDTGRAGVEASPVDVAAAGVARSLKVEPLVALRSGAAAQGHCPRLTSPRAGKSSLRGWPAVEPSDGRAGRTRQSLSC